MEFSRSVIVLLICLALYSGGTGASHHEFEQQANDNVSTEHRTGYHFQPIKNWINDPNGPMFYKGIYHLFYQYNPKGATWGNIVWAHSVSKDLINWKRLESAIYPSKKFDQFGCWSGSATILPGNKPIILYTGIVDHNNTQVQNYAVPADLSDPYLRKWIKPDDNPLIHADDSINMTFFRDPTTAWFVGSHWRIAIGGRRKRRGVAYMYRSRDFKHWVKAQHPLHSTNGTGNWECPDFYPVSVMHRNGLETSARPGPHVKHVLKVSLDHTRFEYYTVGTYNIAKDRYFPDEGMVDGLNGLRYDYGNFYASKSFYDPIKKRRILWGWANESDTTDNDIEKGWAGIQLIPRTIELDPSGKQLVQWPVEEVESLRSKNASGLFNWELFKGEKIEIKGVTPAQADVEVTFSFDSLEKAEPFNSSWDKYDAQKLCAQKNSTVGGALGPFGLITLASQSWEEYTPVYFRIFKDQDQHKHLLLMCSDASRSSLKDPKTKVKNGIDAYRPSFGGFVDVDLEEKRISLRTLIDNSVVESFAARGKLCITSRVYPTLALDANAHMFLFNNGTEKIKIESLNAWSMKRPKEMNQ